MEQVPVPSERSFGLSVGAVLAVLAAFALWRERAALGAVMSTIALLLLAFGAIAPRALRVPNRWWWRFAQAVGWVNSRILLTVFFTVVLTPAGLVMRLLGRSPLRAAARDTNWTAYPARMRNPKHFDHSF